MSAEKRKDSPNTPPAGGALVKRAKQDTEDKERTIILSKERSGTSNALVGTVCSPPGETNHDQTI